MKYHLFEASSQPAGFQEVAKNGSNVHDTFVGELVRTFFVKRNLAYFLYSVCMWTSWHTASE